MDVWTSIIRSQFGAALDMLGNAIDACPDAVWFASGRQAFWYLAFHVLFWTDFYLADVDEDVYDPPHPFRTTEFEDGVYPERAYSREELRGYLLHCRHRLDAFLAGMSESRASEACAVACRKMSRGELLLYNMRHVQHHAAQLNLLLRQGTDSAPRWVSKGQ